MSATMLRAEVAGPGRLDMREVPVPEPGAGEVVVRVDAALTCGTDLKLLRRGHPRIALPAPFGHEFAGTVSAVGYGVTTFRAGDAVAGVPTAPCGQCRLCRRGRENLCPDAVGRIAMGAFAEFLLVPAHIIEQGNLMHRPDTLCAEEAACLEPLACVVHGTTRVALDRAEHVVILGDGPIALLFVQRARAAGARVLLAGRHEIRLGAARAFGAETVTAAGQALRDAVTGWAAQGADLVIECVGQPELWSFAQTLAATGGQVLLYGGCAAGTRADFDTEALHYDEIDLLGAFHYTRADVRTALELLASREVLVAPLITHREPLARLEAALDRVRARQAIKVAVAP